MDDSVNTNTADLELKVESPSFVALGIKLFAFLLMTLVNYPVFVPIIGVLILAACRPVETVVIGIRGIFFLSCLLFLIVAFGVKFWAYDVQFTGPVFAEAFYNNLIALSVMSCVFVYLRGYAAKHPDEIVWLARGAILIHMAVFVFQFAAFYGAGIYLDIFNTLTGIDSRSLNALGNPEEFDGLGGRRLTGLVAEPSNIASILYLLTLVSIMSRRTARFDWIVLPVVLVMFFTFSTLAAVLSILLLGFAILVVSDVRRIVILSMVVGVGAVVFAIVFQEAIFLQIEKGMDSVGIRIEALVYIFERSGWPLYFGHGPFGVEQDLALKASEENAAREISTLSDTGLAVYLMFQFGMMGLLLYVALLFSVGRDWKSLICIGLATLTKFDFSVVVLLVVIAFLATESRRHLRERAALRGAPAT